MKALAIIGCILAFFLILMLCPVSVRVLWKTGDLRVRAHYLFFRFQIYPPKPRKPKKPKAKKEQPQQAAPEEEPPKKKPDIAGLLKEAPPLAKAAGRSLRAICRHTVLDRVWIYLSVGAEDAHKTAESFAKVSAAVYATLGAAGSAFILKEPDVYIAPDFLRGKTLWDLSVRVRIRPLFAVMAGFGLVFRILRVVLKTRKPRPKKKTNGTVQYKGGQKHEPATSGQ